MRNNTAKFAFLAAVIAVVLFSGASHPSLFVSGDAAAGGKTSSTDSAPPLLVLPSLSADIGGQIAADVPPGPGSSTPVSRKAPSVRAAAALVADLQSGNIFFKKNADERWPLASVSKLMTAAVAGDMLAGSQRITITESMVAVDPAQQVLQAGNSFTVSDLMRVMLLPSNNVAAEAFAEFVGKPQFAAAMNAKAREWGMADTYYDDPSGLSAANQSTADDLLKLARHIYSGYPQILAVTRMPQATVNELSAGKAVTIKNINDFAGQADFVGGKTGYTDQANGNLVSLFSYQSRPIFIVVLGTNGPDRFADTRQLFGWLKQRE